MSTTFAGVPSNLIGAASGNVSSQPGAFLDGATLSANAASFPVISFPAWGSLDIRLSIMGFTGSDILSIRFNADAGNNYWDRNFTSVAAGVVLVNTETLTTAQIRVGIAGTKGVSARLIVGNQLAVSKLVNGQVTMGSGVVGTAGIAVLSMSGEWINTTAQITSITVLCVGANSILAGSSIAVYGGL